MYEQIDCVEATVYYATKRLLYVVLVRTSSRERNVLRRKERLQGKGTSSRERNVLKGKERPQGKGTSLRERNVLKGKERPQRERTSPNILPLSEKIPHPLMGIRKEG